jgi:hypothetical protein
VTCTCDGPDASSPAAYASGGPVGGRAMVLPGTTRCGCDGSYDPSGCRSVDGETRSGARWPWGVGIEADLGDLGGVAVGAMRKSESRSGGGSGSSVWAVFSSGFGWPDSGHRSNFYFLCKKLFKNWLIRFKMFVSQSITKLCN